jgi:hypothetical protein
MAANHLSMGADATPEILFTLNILQSVNAQHKIDK